MAVSISTSSNTITGALPPSSRCTRLSVSDAALAIHLPVSGEPVSDTISMSGCVTSDEPAGSPWPVITLNTPVRQHLGGELRELDRADRRGLGGLQDDRAARGKRRADLPDGHHQRVVPRRDLPNHPDRLAADDRGAALHVLAGRRALHGAAGAGEEAQVVRAERDLVLEERLARLARVGRLEVGDLLGVLLERSASFSSAVPRSPGVVFDHSPKARLAAATARFTSSSVESGISAITSPVAGLITSSVAPSAASTNSPSMKFWSFVLLAVAMSGSSPRVPRQRRPGRPQRVCTASRFPPPRRGA